MSWLVDIASDVWSDVAIHMSRGKPWWVWALWAFSPLIALGLGIGLLYLTLR